MSGRRRILFRVARAMISDDAIVSGLVLALLGDAYVWRKSRDWSWALCCLALQLGTMAAVAISGEYWISNSKKRSCVDGENGTAGSERTATRAA
jgi:hypothetical protein